MDDTWISLYRKITETSFYKNSKAVHLAIHCIIKANYINKTILFNNQMLYLEIGQFISGRKVLSAETGLSEQNIRTLLKILEKCKFLTTKSTNKFSLITVCNYKEYQSKEKPNTHQTNQQITNNQPTDNQQITTDNKDNKDNKEIIRDIYPSWLDFNLWKDFLGHRKTMNKNKPISKQCEKVNITELKKYVDQGYTQEEIINRTISHGWKGFFKPKDPPQNNQPIFTYKEL